MDYIFCIKQIKHRLYIANGGAEDMLRKRIPLNEVYRKLSVECFLIEFKVTLLNRSLNFM